MHRRTFQGPSWWFGTWNPFLGLQKTDGLFDLFYFSLDSPSLLSIPRQQSEASAKLPPPFASKGNAVELAACGANF